MTTKPIPPPVVGHKPKINPKTGQPFKINPATGLPFKKKKLVVGQAAKPVTAPTKTAAAKPMLFGGAPKTATDPLKKRTSGSSKIFQKELDEIFKKYSIGSDKKEKKVGTCCPDCKREISNHLDQYYGRTADAEKYCSPCRKSRFGEW